MSQISLAVTAYEESTRGAFEWIRECIAPAVADPMVREIVVVNDGTPDFGGLKDALADTPKLRLSQNEKRLHVFGNKLESVYRSTSEWVLLCDSDNYMPQEYYRTLEDLRPWNPDTWYSASQARPAFDYRELCGTWNLSNVGQMGTFPRFGCFVNTGNQFVHRKRFLDVFGHLRGKRFDLEQPNYFGVEDREDEKWFLVYGAQDSFFLMKEWMIRGGSVHCVPGLEYDHRVETGDLSNYNRAAQEKAALGPVYYLELLDAAAGKKHSYRFKGSMPRGERRYDRGDGRSVTVGPLGRVTMEKQRYITMSQLGHWGRFGNQLLEVAFIHCYAQRYGLQFQVAPWVGQKLFGLIEPPVTVDLPTANETWAGVRGQSIPPEGDEFVGKDWRGYAQYHTSWFKPYQDYIRGLFRPVAVIQERMDPAVERLQEAGETRIGIHLRRGDYGQRNFPIIPVSWYLRWLKQHWGQFEKPVLFIATETPALVEEFDDYAPLTTERLGIDLSNEPLDNYSYLRHDRDAREPLQMDFYPDFHLLQHCEVLLIPSSTFSFFSGMLSTVLRELWRATLTAADFERIDPWDTEPLLREDVRDFPHLEGIELKENPYW